jgi:hypothetical protein
MTSEDSLDQKVPKDQLSFNVYTFQCGNLMPASTLANEIGCYNIPFSAVVLVCFFLILIF